MCFLGPTCCYVFVGKPKITFDNHNFRGSNSGEQSHPTTANLGTNHEDGHIPLSTQHFTHPKWVCVWHICIHKCLCCLKGKPSTWRVCLKTSLGCLKGQGQRRNLPGFVGERTSTMKTKTPKVVSGFLKGFVSYLPFKSQPKRGSESEMSLNKLCFRVGSRSHDFLGWSR